MEGQLLRSSSERAGKMSNDQVCRIVYLSAAYADKRQEDGDVSTPAHVQVKGAAGELERDDAGAAAAQREMSSDSAALWAEVESPPRHVPTLAQFDEHEHAPFEDGEVEEDEDQGPPSNQEAVRRENVDDDFQYAGKLDNYNFVGEHRRLLPLRDMQPTSKKRSFSGSTVSEEGARTARRQRVGSQESRRPQDLPSIREMDRNPWRGLESEDQRSFNIPSVVPMSTPLRSPFVHKVNPFYQDELANVSGRAPTLRGSSIDSVSSVGAGGNPCGRTGSQSTSQDTPRSRAECMEVDEDSEGDTPASFSLLEKPTRSHRGTYAGRPQLGSGPRCLQDIISDRTSPYEASRERNRDELRRGGYRPALEEEDGEPMHEHSANRDARREGLDERTDRFSHFSALPNTKAWRYRQREGCVVRDSRDRLANLEAQAESGFPEDTSYVARAGRQDPEQDEEEEEMESDQEEREKEAERAWRQRRTATRLPTALMAEEAMEDVPTLIDSPHSDKWAIHQSDPEEWYAGMSRDWMRSVWMDENPTVLFSVFNYRFTSNDEINRHIESHVTAITVQLTGEEDFHVVPPEPDSERELSVRELPSIWAIRGLSEAAAWELIKLKVISSRGVSIITHPRTLQNPRYVCGLAGFLRPDVKSTKMAVLNVLESSYMKKRLLELVRSSESMEHLSYAKRVEKVIASLDVRFMETKEDGWVANVFVHPPTDDLEEWRLWAEEMRSCKYNLFLNGTGKARRPFWCAGCRGVDHEELACPFPKSRGWKGPQAGDRLHTKFWAPDAGRGRKPGRGRGQGRGGMYRQLGQFATTSTPATQGRGARGAPSVSANRGRGGFGTQKGSSQRGGYGQHWNHSQRGEYEPYGGWRSEGNFRTPSKRGAWSVRY